MEIRALSGAIVAQLREEEVGCLVESGQSVRDLKNLLSVRCLGGTSRFRQRLLAEEMGELQDDMPVGQLPPSLQLVVLDYCAPEEAVWQALLSACGSNRVVEVASLLQKPLDPNWTGADTDRPPMHHAAENGHLEVARLLLEAGADENAARADGITALMAAAICGRLDMV